MLKKNPVQAKTVALDMTNTEVSLAQKSITQQLLKSADSSKNKQKRERLRKKHEELKGSVSEASGIELKIQPPVSTHILIVNFVLEFKASGDK